MVNIIADITRTETAAGKIFRSSRVKIYKRKIVMT